MLSLAGSAFARPFGATGAAFGAVAIPAVGAAALGYLLAAIRAPPAIAVAVHPSSATDRAWWGEGLGIVLMGKGKSKAPAVAGATWLGVHFRELCHQLLYVLRMPALAECLG